MLAQPHSFPWNPAELPAPTGSEFLAFWVPLPEHSYTPRWPDHSAAGLHELQRSHNEATLSWEQPALVGSSIRRKSEEHTSELQSRSDLVCRLLLEKKKHTRHYT